MATDQMLHSRRTFIQAAGAAAATGLLCSVDSASAQAASGKRLARTSPGQAGISEAGVLAFIDAVEQKVGGLHSFMLLRHGKVAAEGWWAPYAPQLPHMLYSLSKSFTSTAVGFAVTEGLLSVLDPVLSFFPDRAPASPSANLAAMRVRHLLTMNTGHDKDATGPTTTAADGDWVRAFLALPVEHEPGSKFVYNSAATYMLSAIVQKLTGKTVLEYLTPRLFGPLGIESPTWETCPRGINTGGWGLSVRTEDIARFGQLYLQKGIWNGRHLIPSAWVAEATTKQVTNGNGGASDWTQGYGYQFWRCRHNAFRGDGVFGQYCVVMPEQDAVLAITSGVGDMQAVLNAVWDNLLPAMTSTGASAGSESLAHRLARLEVSAPKGTAESQTAARVSGKTWKLNSNAQGAAEARLVFLKDTATLYISYSSGEQRVDAGYNSWKPGRVKGQRTLPRLGAPPVGRIAARGAWTADNTYAMRVCYVETPYVETITCRFTGDEVSISRRMNVSFGPVERPPLIGRLA